MTSVGAIDFSSSCSFVLRRRKFPYADAFRPSTGPTSKYRAVFTRHYCSGIVLRQIEVTLNFLG